jgi:ferredoxin
VRLAIDTDACTGHGRCYAIAPDLFAPNDYGYGRVAGDGDAPADRVDQARLAVANCPERAITLES